MVFCRQGNIAGEGWVDQLPIVLSDGVPKYDDSLPLDVRRDVPVSESITKPTELIDPAIFPKKAVHIGCRVVHAGNLVYFFFVKIDPETASGHNRVVFVTSDYKELIILLKDEGTVRTDSIGQF